MTHFAKTVPILSKGFIEKIINDNIAAYVRGRLTWCQLLDSQTLSHQSLFHFYSLLMLASDDGMIITKSE